MLLNIPCHQKRVVVNTLAIHSLDKVICNCILGGSLLSALLRPDLNIDTRSVNSYSVQAFVYLTDDADPGRCVSIFHVKLDTHHSRQTLDAAYERSDDFKVSSIEPNILGLLGMYAEGFGTSISTFSKRAARLPMPRM